MDLNVFYCLPIAFQRFEIFGFFLKDLAQVVVCSNQYLRDVILFGYRDCILQETLGMVVISEFVAEHPQHQQSSGLTPFVLSVSGKLECFVQLRDDALHLANLGATFSLFPELFANQIALQQ